jgi:hypothetical protein
MERRKKLTKWEEWTKSPAGEYAVASMDKKGALFVAFIAGVFAADGGVNADEKGEAGKD